MDAFPEFFGQRFHSRSHGTFLKILGRPSDHALRHQIQSLVAFMDALLFASVSCSEHTQAHTYTRSEIEGSYDDLDEMGELAVCFHHEIHHRAIPAQQQTPERNNKRKNIKTKFHYKCKPAIMPVPVDKTKQD